MIYEFVKPNKLTKTGLTRFAEFQILLGIHISRQHLGTLREAKTASHTKITSELADHIL